MQPARKLAIVLLACVSFAASFAPSHALQYRRLDVGDGDVLIGADGPIVEGDLERLKDFIGRLPSTDNIIGFSVDSPGGSIIEAEKLAGLIHRLKTAVVISGNSECSSACFLLLAAAAKRFAAIDALVGVHSSSQNGKETLETMGITTLLARDAADYGVPPAIIGKMVQTPPGRVAWLTPDELAAMDVVIMRPKPASPPPPAYTPPAVSPSNPPVASAQPQGPSTAFDQGSNDRRAWEAWFGSLVGDYREGAFYWSGQRSLPQPGSCFGPNGQNMGDWTRGCLEAQKRLAPTDVRRRSEPEYRRGWNSL